MSPINKSITYFSVIFLSALISCTHKLSEKNEVVVHELNDPEMLNPIISTDATSLNITSYMFQKLIAINYKNPTELIPVLAESRPLIEKTNDGRMSLTFRIRPEAKWDNNTPITAKDVEFTLKTIKNPMVNNQNVRHLFSYISDFIFYPNDTKKFTILSNEIYFQAETEFTDISILPEYFYDPKGLMKNYTVKMFAQNADSLQKDIAIQEFAKDFNSERRMRDPKYIAGSGPYSFTGWKTNERVILCKKENWWGDKVKNKNCYFEAYPDKLIFQTIQDPTSAIVALKAGNLDVMSSIQAKDFKEFQKSEKFMENFATYTPMQYSFSFIGLNLKSPLLSDKLTRQALAYTIDVDAIIKAVLYGDATRIIGPINPSKKNAYNNQIPLYEHNQVKAKELLTKSGWKDSDEDGILDKIINGEKTDLVLNYITTPTSEHKAIALMFKEQAKKIGVNINITLLDWAIFIDRCKSHQFDLMYLNLISSPTPDDLQQIFYSTSVMGGDNYSNFSNAEADVLIDSIRIEIDASKRDKMYLRIQKILHEEVPMIFLYAPKEHLAIRRKFINAYPSSFNPGYWLPGFKLKTTHTK